MADSMLPPKISGSKKGEIVQAIRYNNIVYISEVIANEIAEIPIGERLDFKKLDKAIRSFYNQGYFEDVWVSFDSGVLNFFFKEKPRIGSIEIKGYGNDSERTALIEQLGLKRGDMFDQIKLDRSKQTIKTVLEQKGYYGSVVEFDTQPIAQSNAYNVVININRGNEIIINKAIYEGREKVSIRDIEALSANKERDFMGWMWGLNDGKLHLGELEYDSLRIRDVYMRQGFLDAEVSPPFLSVNFNDYNASLFYKIVEGTRYKVSGVDVVLENPVIPEESLYSDLTIKKGQYFDVQKLRTDMESIKTKISDAGYPFANVNPDLDKRDSEVKIIYYVSSGKKVFINDVIISGNTRTSDRVIRREILLAPGDLFNLSRVRDSENALRRLGFFESVRIDTRRVSEDSMDLLVNVVETRTGELMFGLGFGSYDGFTVNASVRERNLFGTGNSGQIYMDISSKRQSYNIGLTNPRIFDSRFSGSFEVFRSSYVDYNYTENNTGFSISAGRLLTDNLRASLSFGVSQTTLTDFDPSKEAFYKSIFPNQSPWKVSLTPSLSFDNTDDYYFPKNGIIASTYLEYAGFGGDENYLKFYAKAAFYHHLKKWMPLDLIARYKVQGGYLLENGYAPVNNFFSMGGVSTVRGYQSGSLSPSPIGLDGYYAGGNYIFTNSVELSYGLFESLQMRISAFYDFGLIGNHKRNLLNSAYRFSEEPIMRQSAGLAIEWVSPIGPIVLVFPWAINPRPEDRTSKFEFTMGTRF